MSRIAGLLLDGDAEYRAALLRGMLRASQANADWQVGVAASERVAIGWSGWRAPNVAVADGVLVVMDGCIYNRAELGPADGDAALLGELYRRYGFTEALQRVNGDFAVAVYDQRTDTFWLARDRFGVKPLYYVADSVRFAFASRPRALLTLPGVSREVNRRFVATFAASHYRYFDNEPERSPYADIAQLPAAHVLRVAQGCVTKSAYWALEEQPDFATPEVELAERYREHLLDAVSLRLTSASRPAFTLSGGMDSSSVLASAVRVAGRKQHAFSTVYSDETYDEREAILPMLGPAVEAWHPVSVGMPDVFGLVERMVEAHDEPVATATWLSHYLLCEEAANAGFGGLFGGLGGDELNAGEYEYFTYHFADLRAAGREDELAREVELWARHHDHPVYRKSRHVAEANLATLVNLARPGACQPDRGRLGRYAQALNREYFDLGAFDPVMDHPFRSYLKNRAYQDISRETAPCCLRAEDRQTTAFGLEHFLPFFDHRLVEFAFRIAGRQKIRDGVTKRLLREAMRGVLPEETRSRIRKTGWNAPAHVWFSGRGREQLRDLVRSQSFRQRGIYDLAAVERLIDEHDAVVRAGVPQESHMMFLWQLVNLELWLRAVDAQASG